MTTRSTTPTSRTGPLVDAPAIHLDKLTHRQRQGKSCCWCAGTADSQFPVRLVAGVDLYSCVPCAGMYGVPAAEQETRCGG